MFPFQEQNLSSNLCLGECNQMMVDFSAIVQASIVEVLYCYLARDMVGVRSYLRERPT